MGVAYELPIIISHPTNANVNFDQFCYNMQTGRDKRLVAGVHIIDAHSPRWNSGGRLDKYFI